MTSPQPQVVDARALAARVRELGAQWSLSGERELEANVVHIPPGDGIGDHASGLDVVIVGIAGEGTVTAGAEAWRLQAGVLIFVPRSLVRAIRSGGSGLTYLTIHRRRDDGLAVGGARPGAAGD
jgi:quercetin dioxygenase-like cupin family protein